MRDRRHGILLRLARRGHEEAFTRLYGELFGPVAGYVSVRVRNREDAEDLTSGIFQGFLENLDRYDRRSGSVMTWTLAMARHAVIDHHRRRSAHGGARTSAVDPNELEEILAGAEDDPLTALVKDEQTSRLARLLRSQPPEVREMFFLRYGQGLGLKDVAKVMGLTEDAVKQRFARTVRRLKSELSSEEIQGETRQTGKGGKTCTATD